MKAAAEALRMAEANGVRITVEGDELVLVAEQAPLPEILEALRYNKPGIVQLLAPSQGDSVATAALSKPDFERRPDDDRQMIDPRCATALLECWNLPGVIWVPTVHGGSILADELERLRNEAIYRSSDVFRNPLPIAKEAVVHWPAGLPGFERAIRHLRDRVLGGTFDLAAILVRPGWDRDGAITSLISSPPFAGIIRQRPPQRGMENHCGGSFRAFEWLIFDGRHKGELLLRYWPSRNSEAGA